MINGSSTTNATEATGRTSSGAAPGATGLADRGALNLAGTAVGGVCSLALVVAVTNGFEQRVAGTLFAATSLFLIVTALCELGADAGLSYTVQRALVADRQDRARRALPIALVPVLAASGILAVAGWALAGWLSDTVLDGADGAVAMVRILAVTLPVATAYTVTLAATRAYGTMRPNVLVEKLGRLPGQILLVLVVAVSGGGPVWLGLAWALPYVPALLLAASALRPLRSGLRPHPFPATGEGRDPDEPDTRAAEAAPGDGWRAEARAFWAFTAPRSLGRMCQVALQRADVVLVAAILGPGAAALYTAVTKVVAAGQLLTLGLQQVLQPQLSRLFAAGDTGGADELFRTATAWVMALAWPFYLTAAIAAPVVLRVFGAEYVGTQAYVSTVVLALAMLFATACGPVDTALLMAGRSRQSLGNAVAALAVNLALIGLLVPRLGVVGAALAWSAGLIVRNLLPVVQVWRGLGLFAFGPAAVRVAALAAGCFLPLLVLLALPPAPAGARVLALLVGVPLLGGAYAWLLWRHRHLLELAAFRPLVRRVLGLPRRMAGWVRGRTGWLARQVRRLPLPHRVRVALSTVLLRRLRPVRVPLDHLLLGSQDGMTAQRYADAFDDPMWGSTPVADGPHAALLEAARGRELSDREILESPYGEHARRCLLLTGRYFSASDEQGIVRVARGFLARAAGSAPSGDAPSGDAPSGSAPSGSAHSGPRDPVLVAPIRDSDRYSVLDGHHRLALAAHRGERLARVTVKRVPVTTPLQDLLNAMSWIGGRRELYQPLDAPELRKSWTTVRACTDRLEKMRLFLAARGLARTEYRKPSYLDVACCYGWFVARMGEQGFLAEGVEADPLARRLASAAYGVDPERIHTGDAGEFLRARVEQGRRFDVVSCFSLLHHFLLGRGSGTSAEELVGLLSGVTRSVLFLDTGQEHEAWFARSLAGWSPERIASFLAEHGDFAEVVDLGPDEDAVPPYERNYGRHLFACVK